MWFQGWCQENDAVSRLMSRKRGGFKAGVKKTRWFQGWCQENDVVSRLVLDISKKASTSVTGTQRQMRADV